MIDPGAAQLDAQRLEERRLREFRRAVAGAPWNAVLAGEAADSHQKPAPGLQVRQRMARAPKAAEIVDAHHRLVPREVLHVLEKSVARDARVVDEDIDAAQALGGAVD